MEIEKWISDIIGGTTTYDHEVFQRLYTFPSFNRSYCGLICKVLLRKTKGIHHLVRGCPLEPNTPITQLPSAWQWEWLLISRRKLFTNKDDTSINITWRWAGVTIIILHVYVEFFPSITMAPKMELPEEVQLLKTWVIWKPQTLQQVIN